MLFSYQLDFVINLCPSQRDVLSEMLFVTVEKLTVFHNAENVISICLLVWPGIRLPAISFL